MSHSLEQNTQDSHQGDSASPNNCLIERTSEIFDPNEINLLSLAQLNSEALTVDSHSSEFNNVTLEELLQAIKIAQSQSATGGLESTQPYDMLSKEGVSRIMKLYGANPNDVETALIKLREEKKEDMAKIQHLERLKAELTLPNTKLGLPEFTPDHVRHLEEKIHKGISGLIDSIRLTDSLLKENPARIREIADTDGEVKQLFEYSGYHRGNVLKSLKSYSVHLTKNHFNEFRWTLSDVLSLPFCVMRNWVFMKDDDYHANNFSYQTPVLHLHESPSIRKLISVGAEFNFDVSVTLKTNHLAGVEYAQLVFSLTHKASQT